MLREYEITVILSNQPQENELKQTVEKYEAILLADGGEVVRKSDWGVKKLAFPIKKQFRGRYLHWDLTAKPENIKEAERLMRIDDHILRYLSIKIGENVDVNERKAEIARHEAEAARNLRNESRHAMN